MANHFVMVINAGFIEDCQDSFSLRAQNKTQLTTKVFRIKTKKEGGVSCFSFNFWSLFVKG